MKKIFFLIFSLLFLFSCSFWNTGKNVKNEQGGNQVLKKEISYTKLIEQNPSIIEQNKDYNFCMTQAVDTCQKQSFSQIVDTMKDISNCEEFKNQELVSDCKDMIYQIQAVKNLDTQLCKNMRSEKVKKCENIVISEKANKEENIDLCNQINSEKNWNEEDFWNQDMCKMVIINKKVMQNKKDKELCNTLKEQTFKNECMVLMQ